MSTRSVADGDDALAVDAVEAVDRGNGDRLQCSHRRVVIAERCIDGAGHVGVVRAVVEGRQRHAGTFYIKDDADVRLIGILPAQVGVVHCL